MSPISAKLTRPNDDAILKCISASAVSAWYRNSPDGRIVDLMQDDGKKYLVSNDSLTVLKVGERFKLRICQLKSTTLLLLYTAVYKRIYKAQLKGHSYYALAHGQIKTSAATARNGCMTSQAVRARCVGVCFQTRGPCGNYSNLRRSSFGALTLLAGGEGAFCLVDIPGSVLMSTLHFNWDGAADRSVPVLR